MAAPVCSASCITLSLAVAVPGKKHGSRTRSSEHPCRDFGRFRESVPKEADHREIAVRVQMVYEVKLLRAPEPSEAREARSFDVYSWSR
jgi:hypothetical protein